MVHNTLWIVAHFHTMALLNITMIMFALIYFMIEDYTGRKVYDGKLAEDGMWAKYIGTLGFVHMWFIQGIMGAIRRRTISSPGYGFLTWLSIPFGLLILIGFWISTYVLWKTIAGPSEVHLKIEKQLQTLHNDILPFFPPINKIFRYFLTNSILKINTDNLFGD